MQTCFMINRETICRLLRGNFLIGHQTHNILQGFEWLYCFMYNLLQDCSLQARTGAGADASQSDVSYQVHLTLMSHILMQTFISTTQCTEGSPQVVTEHFYKIDKNFNKSYMGKYHYGYQSKVTANTTYIWICIVFMN